MSYYILTDDYTEIKCNKRRKLFKIIKETEYFQFLEHVGYKYLTGYILIQPNPQFNRRRAYGTIIQIN